MKMNHRVIILALPVILLFLLFHVFPVGMAGYYSFVNNPFDRVFSGIGNYADVLQNKFFHLAVKNTLFFTLPAVILSWGIAFLMASLIWRMGNAHGGLLGILLLPLVIPSNAVTQIWRILFPLNEHSFVAVLTIFLWKNTGFSVLLLFSGLSALPASCVEAAQLDGAGNGVIIFRIALPMIRQQAFFVAILMAVYSLRIFKESYLLYGAYPPDSLYFIQTYINNHFSKLNYASMTVAAIVMQPIITLLAFIWTYSERKRGDL